MNILLGPDICLGWPVKPLRRKCWIFNRVTSDSQLVKFFQRTNFWRNSAPASSRNFSPLSRILFSVRQSHSTRFLLLIAQFFLNDFASYILPILSFIFVTGVYSMLLGRCLVFFFTQERALNTKWEKNFTGWIFLSLEFFFPPIEVRLKRRALENR